VLQSASPESASIERQSTMASKFSVPKGFKKVDNGIAGFWKPTKEGEGLQGIVGHMVETPGADGKPNRFFTVRVTTEESGPIVSNTGRVVKTEVGTLVGVGGRVLANFLGERAGSGREVVLVYKGLGKAKTGRNAPKLYETYDSEEMPG